MKYKYAAFLMLGFVAGAAAQPPLQLHPQNPHYFLFRGRPTVLVTSGEHYGAVINRAFNSIPYLDELKRNHLNLTRLWVGPYRESAGDFAISHNSLAPLPGDFIAPWARTQGARSQTAAAADNGNRFDLSQWNPEYFRRLVDFVAAARERGIVVEVNLFCPYYEDSMWRDSPLNSANNGNGIGDVKRTEVLTLKHPELVAAEDRMVRKIVAELNRFDNVYYEICNEPYFAGVTLDWQQHISDVIAEEEAKLPVQHLISQNIANGSKKVDNPNPRVSIFNFHYSRPPESVAMNYALNRVIGYNETGFDGNADAVYRVQAWDFLTAGGGLFNNLDYSFCVGHERGDFTPDAKTPGGGSPALRQQLGALKKFFDRLPLIEMRPASDILAGGVPQGAAAYVLAKPGSVYLLHLSHPRVEAVKENETHFSLDENSHQATLVLNLPAGSYRAEWIDPRNVRTIRKWSFQHAGGPRALVSPRYNADIALYLRAQH